MLQHSSLGTDSCFHLISCHQPFVSLVSCTLGNLQILEEMEHKSGSCLAHPFLQSLGTGQVRPQDINAPSCHRLWILVALQDRGAGILPWGQAAQHEPLLRPHSSV